MSAGEAAEDGTPTSQERTTGERTTGDNIRAGIEKAELNEL